MISPPRCRTSSRRLQDVFYAEAKKYNVLPLDNSTLARFLTQRPSATAGRNGVRVLRRVDRRPGQRCAPNILAKSYIIEAEVEIPEGGAEGMIVTEGGRFGGYGLFLSKGDRGHRPGQAWCSSTTCSISSGRPGKDRSSSAGKHTIGFDFKYDGPGFGKGGTGVLFVDGK